MGVFNCFMYRLTLFYVHSSFAVILMGKRKLAALLNLISLCLAIAVWLFLASAMGLSAVCDCGFPDHTHLLILHIQTKHFYMIVSIITFPKVISNVVNYIK